MSPKKTVLRTNFLGYSKDSSLDPSSLKFVQEYFILDNITAKLIGIGDNNQYVNDLAKSVVFSKNNKEITIELKEAYFSDGSRIHANDVAISFKRAAILGSPHTNIKNLWLGSKNLKTIYDEIPGIKVINSSKLLLRLTRATKEITYFMSLTDLAVLHKSQYTKNKLTAQDWTDITSGPYKINYDSEGKMFLKSNPKTLNYSRRMPQTVTFGNYKGDDVLKRLENKNLDLGMITFGDYLNHSKRFETIRGYEIVSEKTDGIIYLILNLDSTIFKDKKTRQFVQKTVLDKFNVKDQYSNVTQKAYQFFLPNAKGYVNKDIIKNLLDHVSINNIPKKIKDGLTIRTLGGMKYYLPSDLSETLTKTLGFPVKIETSISTKNYSKEIYEKRNFDATIIGVGMSYKVLGEALNLQYLSKNPSLLDPSGKIKALLEKYQKEDDIDSEAQVIEEIIKQMVIDSECVPLFYFSSPFFVNKSTVTSTKLNLMESIKFYKTYMK